MFSYSRQFAATVLPLVIAASAHADAVSPNHVVADLGVINVPLTMDFGNTITKLGSAGFTFEDGQPVVFTTIAGRSYFYDDYAFTLPSTPLSVFNASAITIDLKKTFALDHFEGRLYKLGNDGLTTEAVPSAFLLQDWTSVDLTSKTTVVVFEDVPLENGATYAMEFRATVAGTSGGSYGGNLNIVVAEVPEPGSLALVLASLGVVGFVAQRRKV